MLNVKGEIMDDETRRGLEIIKLNSGEYFKKIDRLFSKIADGDYEMIKKEFDGESPYFKRIDSKNKNK